MDIPPSDYRFKNEVFEEFKKAYDEWKRRKAMYVDREKQTKETITCTFDTDGIRIATTDYARNHLSSAFQEKISDIHPTFRVLATGGVQVEWVIETEE